MSRRHIALDLEFVKCRGQYLTRAIAFVPFARSPTATRTPASPTTTSSSDAHDERTCFTQPATVLSLRAREVMRRADILPCGHILRAHMANTLVHGEALATIKRQLAAEVDEGAVAQYREMQNACQAIVHAALHKADNTNKKESKKYTKAGGGGCATLPRELQTQLAIAEHFTMFDAYGIPNIRRCDGRLLRLLYEAAPDSATYIHAVRELAFLRRYGQGKGGQRSLAYLARYYPRFTQSVLRASFASATQWQAWLEECARLVERDLEQMSARYQTAAGRSRETQEVQWCEYDSVPDLAEAMSRSWHRHLYTGADCTRTENTSSEAGRGKFYVYGNMDRKVIHATLQLCRQEGAKEDKEGDDGVVQAPAMLRSPFEAHVIDLTAHALFVAAGFTRRNLGRVPALAAALEMASGADRTARTLRSEGRAHDPLWDARALACVCVGAGIG